MSALIKWIKEHISPHIGWKKYPEELNEEKNKIKDKDDLTQDIKEHIEVGFKIKWKF